MAHSNVSSNLLGLARSFRRLRSSDPLIQCLAPRLNRNFASTTEIPIEEVIQHESTPSAHTTQGATTAAATPSLSTSSRVLTTLYSWPDLEPTRYAWYGSQYLDLPLRKDLLHRAVVFEGNAKRQGTASTKWRGDVHGSNRKLAPQKGLGRARVGDKKSPSRRGGGVAFGPHPRDFSTELPRKIYDIAWRTALSHRYRKGELIILENPPLLPTGCSPRLLHNIFTGNQWGKSFGRSLVVTETYSDSFFDAMEQVGEHGAAKDLDDVDVKDLLKFGRVIIDTTTLNTLFAAHSHDLGSGMTLDKAREAVFLKETVEGPQDSSIVQYSHSAAPSL